MQIDASVINPLSILPEVPVVVCCLWTEIILRVVEEALVVEVKVVGKGLPVVASRVRVGRVPLAVRSHVGKSGVVVINEPRVNTIGGGGTILDTEEARTRRGVG